MFLGIRHAARFKPAIEDLVNSFEGWSIGIFLRRNFQLVDEFAMKVCHLGATQFLQLSDAANTNHFTKILVRPNWERGSPESTPRDGPISGVLQPVVKPNLSYVFWDPTNVGVVIHDLIADFFYLNKPGTNRFVDQRGIRPPTEWVRMHQHIFLNQPTAFFDVGDQCIVGLLHVNAFRNSNFVGEETVGVYGTGEIDSLFDDSVRHTNTEIVLSKGGSLMNDSRTGIVGDIGVGENLEECFRSDKIVKQWLIPLALELGTQHSLLDSVQFVCHFWFPLLFVVHDGIDL
mmetsp:Transcript_1536/g.3402  ORF Transcript_1536/g.3402 Transcript_1536/m.3402 type:complete len:288 (-) Transcript_1536:939-1802(-)